MSPQLEQGYTRIADTILEKVAQTKLNGTQFRILMIVWRSTYGWQKKEHELSLGYLAKATNIHKQQVKKELDKMIKLEIISVVKPHTDTTPRILGFNKNYVKEVQSVEKSTVSEKAHPTVSKLTYPTVSELDYQNKELNKQYKDIDVFNHYLSLDLIKHRSLTGDMKKAMKLARQELNCNNEFLTTLLDRHKSKVESTKGDQFPIKPRPIQEFFGQKKYQSKMLICSDYDDGVWNDSKKVNLQKTDTTGFIDLDAERTYYD